MYTWTWAHAPTQEMRVTIELQALAPDRTRIVITHADIVDGEIRRYEGGWREGLARLRTVVAKK